MSVKADMFAGLVIGLLFVIAISIGVVGVWFQAHNEAKSYRKFCDTPVTTWDAVFLELRIDMCHNKE